MLAVAGSRRALDFLWVVLAALGIVLITPWSAGPGALDLVGVLLALFAGVCWATYIVLGGRLSRVLPGGRGSRWGWCSPASRSCPSPSRPEWWRS
ncbi:hypothetical protein ACN28S_66140 [Cystobacter fuscus]